MFSVSKGVLEAIGMSESHMKNDSPISKVDSIKMKKGGSACTKTKMAMGGVGKQRLHELK